MIDVIIFQATWFFAKRIGRFEQIKQNTRLIIKLANTNDCVSLLQLRIIESVTAFSLERIVCLDQILCIFAVYMIRICNTTSFQQGTLFIQEYVWISAFISILLHNSLLTALKIASSNAVKTKEL